MAVVHYLVERAGVDPASLEAIGAGGNQPLDPANNESAWRRNRRVEIRAVR